MKNILTAILIASLIMLSARVGLCQQATATPAAKQTQSAPPLDEKARKIKRMVEKIGVAGRLTLYLQNGDKLHGSVVQYDAESVQVAEIDLKQVITIQYRYIKKIREDYGKRDPLTGVRSNPPKGFKIGLTVGLLFVAIGLPIIVLASMKD
ncbi:MAG TPA: hypothetical protein VJS44_16370 [Pyrinomonadaceae bacterium]|nr:hypothetical protein [Pyrinomonadaceae bacterium]